MLINLEIGQSVYWLRDGVVLGPGNVISYDGKTTAVRFIDRTIFVRREEIYGTREEAGKVTK